MSLHQRRTHPTPRNKGPRVVVDPATLPVDYTKRCGHCKTVKGKAEFNRNGHLRDGLATYCKPCHRASVKDYKRRNPEWARDRAREDKGRLREQVLAAYGGSCACCGESTPQFLAVDHIYNDGAEHRRAVSGLYRWLRQQGFPRDRFQLLCHNCNSAKGLYGACPHTQFSLLAGGAA